MYKVSGVSIKEFITDTKIKLPRFQRKKTWNDKDNFKLCISLFKDYPIGVSIVSVERVKKDGVIRELKFLLDGRQRREALKELSIDPENLYRWACAFLKIRKNDSDADVTDKFYEIIGAFLEEENEDKRGESEETVEEEVGEVNTEELSEEVEEDEDVDPSLFENGEETEESEQLEQTEQPEQVSASIPSDGLALMLMLILKTHHWSKKGSGFTSPFDFNKFFQTLPYVNKTSGNNYTLSSRALKSFISSYKDDCVDKYGDDEAYRRVENFISYVLRTQVLNTRVGNTTKGSKILADLKDAIKRHWGAMLERIELLQKLDEKLQSNQIGVIEVNGMQSYDYQKIFNLINSGGSDLKAVEILSAKPKWNGRIVSPSADFLQYARQLYKELGTYNESYVKWDMAATFISRLDENNFFFKKYSNSASDFEAKITAGFIVLSGIYEGAVNKDAFDKLGSNPDIKWDRDIDQLLVDIKTMSRVLCSFSYFNFFNAWKLNLQSLTSDYIAYNFFILCYKNWISKGKPIGSDSATTKFQKECFYLLDRMIFEYVTGVWKGSGDSRVKRNLENLNNNFVQVSQEDWMNLLTGIFERNKINDADIKLDQMKSILFHFYCLNQQIPPTTMSSQFDVDHIIPQKSFEDSSYPNKEIIKDNLLNLALLPKRENCSKGKKTLVEIRDSWLRTMIKEYEFIQPEDFEKFSDITNYQKMFDKRRPIFENAFKVYREQLLNN